MNFLVKRSVDRIKKIYYAIFVFCYNDIFPVFDGIEMTMFIFVE